MDENTGQTKPDHQLPNLPNATTVLVLGIISLACLIGVRMGIGTGSISCGIIGLVLAGKDRKLYNAAPNAYSPESFRTSNYGRVCSIIGLVVGGVLLLGILIIDTLFAWPKN